MCRILTIDEARFFGEQFRIAREAALKDAEDFDEVIFALERLGSFRFGRVSGLGDYKDCVLEEAAKSPLADCVPGVWPGLHTRAERLYELVKTARNDALHQGAFARRLTDHAVQLSLILEDALKRGHGMAKVGEYMVRNPIHGELWHPISYLRQIMLANAFSYLPVQKDLTWRFVSDLAIASFLASAQSENERKRRLASALQDCASIALEDAITCSAEEDIIVAIEKFCSNPRPILVTRPMPNANELVGILAPFDLL